MYEVQKNYFANSQIYISHYGTAKYDNQERKDRRNWDMSTISCRVRAASLHKA